MPWQQDKPDYLSPLETRETLLQSWREATKICRADARAQATENSKSLRAKRRDVDLEVGE